MPYRSGRWDVTQPRQPGLDAQGGEGRQEVDQQAHPPQDEPPGAGTSADAAHTPPRRKSRRRSGASAAAPPGCASPPAATSRSRSPAPRRSTRRTWPRRLRSSLRPRAVGHAGEREDHQEGEQSMADVVRLETVVVIRASHPDPPDGDEIEAEVPDREPGNVRRGSWCVTLSMTTAKIKSRNSSSEKVLCSRSSSSSRRSSGRRHSGLPAGGAASPGRWVPRPFAVFPVEFLRPVRGPSPFPGSLGRRGGGGS